MSDTNQQELAEAMERADHSWAGGPLPVGPGISEGFRQAAQDRRTLAAEVSRLEEQLRAVEKERDEWKARSYGEGANWYEQFARAERLQEQLETMQTACDVAADYSERVTQRAEDAEQLHRDCHHSWKTLMEQYGTLRAAVDAFFAEPFDYQRPCWDSFCGGGRHTTLCNRVNALAHTSFPAESHD